MKPSKVEKNSAPEVNFILKEEETAGSQKKGGEEGSINFSSFLFSLSSAALMAMGEMPAPDGFAAIEPDVGLAKQNIDILELIAQKTKGNLSEEEKRLLEGLLYNLRTKFIECREKSKK